MQQFSDWLKGIIKETLNKLLEIERDDGFNELMNATETCKFLGIDYSTFQKYRYSDDFPKELPAKHWSKRAIKNDLKIKFKASGQGLERTFNMTYLIIAVAVLAFAEILTLTFLGRKHEQVLYYQSEEYKRVLLQN